MNTKTDSKIKGRKVLRIPCDWLVSLFVRGICTQEFARVPRVRGIPETAHVCGVYYNYDCDAWDIVLEDESFEVTIIGERLPRIEVEYQTVKVAIQHLSPAEGGKSRSVGN